MVVVCRGNAGTTFALLKLPKSTRFLFAFDHAMIPEPYELFDIDRGSDKLFLIGTAWIVLFLFLL